VDALIREVQEEAAKEAAKKVASLLKEHDRSSPSQKTGRDSTLSHHKEYESKARQDIE
jgi:hypothetical protein